LPQPVGKLLHQLRDPVIRRPPNPGFKGPSKFGEHIEVPLDRFRDARPLHLDDHRLTGAKLSPICLTDGGGRDGLPIEGSEHIVDGPPEVIAKGKLTAGRRAGVTWSWRRPSSCTKSAGSRSARVEAPDPP